MFLVPFYLICFVCLASTDKPEDSEDVDITLDDCYIAVADYAAASVDEVDLYEGQVVCVIDDSDAG